MRTTAIASGEPTGVVAFLFLGARGLDLRGPSTGRGDVQRVATAEPLGAVGRLALTAIVEDYGSFDARPSTAARPSRSTTADRAVPAS